MPLRCAELRTGRAVQRDDSLPLLDVPQAPRHGLRHLRRGADRRLPLDLRRRPAVCAISRRRTGFAPSAACAAPRGPRPCPSSASSSRLRRRFEGELGIKPQSHIFVGSKAPWDAITDDLPQFDAYPPGFGAQGVARPVVTPRAGITEGSCLCGEIGYEITGAPVRMMNCHCSRCRLGRAAAHATNVFYKLDQFRWVRGASLVTEYKVPDARFHTVAFCSRCGGKVPRPSPERGIVVVPAGSLDTDPGMRAQAHIFVADKAPWFDITGPLPQFSGNAAGIGSGRACFPQRRLSFLDEVAANNNRAWFEANKSRYESVVREPALEFIAAMGPVLDGFAPNFRAEPRKVGGSLMRVFRDTRFSRDKAPYKTNIGIQFRHCAGQRRARPGLLSACLYQRMLPWRRLLASRGRCPRANTPSGSRRSLSAGSRRAMTGSSAAIGRLRAMP